MPAAPRGLTGTVPIPDAVTVLDSFIDERFAATLAQSFAPLKDGCDQTLSTVLVPSELECRMRCILASRAQSVVSLLKESASLSLEDCIEPWVTMPGRVAKGSSHMHHDAGFDPSGTKEDIVTGYVAVLYLAGHGSLVLDCGSGECAIDVKPGRLILWPNCLHRLDASPGDEARVMIGPMHLTEDGSWRRAGLHADWYWYPPDYKGEDMEPEEHRKKRLAAEAEARRKELEAEEAVILQLESDFDSSTGKLTIHAANLAGNVEFEISMDSVGAFSTLQVLRANLKGLHRATLMVGATKLPGAEGPGSDPGRPLADTPLVKEAHFEAEFRKYEADCVKPVCREDEEKVSGENDADRKLREMIQEIFWEWDTDTNGDGTVSLEGLHRIVRAIDPSGLVTTEGVQKIFTTIDTNKDGKIDFDELFAWIYADLKDVLEGS